MNNSIRFSFTLKAVLCVLGARFTWTVKTGLLSGIGPHLVWA